MKKSLFVVLVIIVGILIVSCDLLTVRPPTNPNDPNYDPDADPDYVFHPPTSLAAVDQGGEIVITWADNVKEEDGFILERSTTDTSIFSEIYTSAANVQFYTDKTAVYNNTYFYRICSYKTGEEKSYYSESVQIDFIDDVPPNPAESLNATSSGTTITLAWITPSDEDIEGLLIARSISPISWEPTDGNTYAADNNVSISERIILIDELLEPPSQYSDTGLSSGTTYYYAIFLYDEFKNYSSSTTDSAYIGTDTPVVLGLTDDPDPKKSKTWNWSSNLTGAEFIHLIDTTETNPTDWGSSTWGSTATATQPDGDTTYYIHVQARFGIGNESSIETVSAILDNTPPAVPVVTSTTPTNDTTPIWDWDSVEGADYYRYGFTDGIWTDTIDASTTEYQYDSVLSAGGPYTLYVQAGDDADNWSTSGSFPITIDLTAPTITGLTDDTIIKTSKTWDWDSDDVNAEFRFIVDTNPADPADWTNATWGTEKNVSQLTGDGAFYLHVQARDLAGNISDTETVNVNLDNTPPSIDDLSDSTTPTQSITWNWTSDDENAEFRFIINNSSYAITDWTGIEWVTTTSVSQPSGNGDFYLHIQSRDDLENESNLYTFHAILDNTVPIITLIGDDPVNINVDDSFSDPGASATDNIDDNTQITSAIDVGGDTVDNSVAGTYVITYNVSDTAGNAATEVTRNVNVIQPGELLVNIDLSDPQDITIGFSGQEAILNPSTPSMTIAATASGVATYIWYLDGAQTGSNSSSIMIDSSGLFPGLHTIDLVILTTESEYYSTGFNFEVEN